MNSPRCSDLDYIHFLIAAQKAITCTEAARCQPEKPLSPAHDAFTRLLKRQPPDTEALWREAQTVVNREKGLLVLDDTTLDKPYAEKMDLVTYRAREAVLWDRGGSGAGGCGAAESSGVLHQGFHSSRVESAAYGCELV